jgi:hypothetical protein
MANETRCDLTRRLIAPGAPNAGRDVTHVRLGSVVLRIEAVEPCDLHPEALRQVVRDGVAVDVSEGVLPMRRAR